MKTVALVTVGLAVGIIAGDCYVAHRRYAVLHQLVDPALAPGRICDEVAAGHEPKATVGWYHACINYAAELQAKNAATSQGDAHD